MMMIHLEHPILRHLPLLVLFLPLTPTHSAERELHLRLESTRIQSQIHKLNEELPEQAKDFPRLVHLIATIQSFEEIKKTTQRYDHLILSMRKAEASQLIETSQEAYKELQRLYHLRATSPKIPEEVASCTPAQVEVTDHVEYIELTLCPEKQHATRAQLQEKIEKAPPAILDLIATIQSFITPKEEAAIVSTIKAQASHLSWAASAHLLHTGGADIPIRIKLSNIQANQLFQQSIKAKNELLHLLPHRSTPTASKSIKRKIVHTSQWALLFLPLTYLLSLFQKGDDKTKESDHRVEHATKVDG